MCPPDADIIRSEGDLPGTSVPPAEGYTPGSASRRAPGAEADAPTNSLGSSTGGSGSATMATSSTAPQTDPANGGTVAPTASASGADATEMLSSGSVADSSPVVSPVSSQPQRPTTRLQRGIQCPKTYTDGTVR